MFNCNELAKQNRSLYVLFSQQKARIEECEGELLQLRLTHAACLSNLSEVQRELAVSKEQASQATHVATERFIELNDKRREIKKIREMASAEYADSVRYQLRDTKQELLTCQRTVVQQAADMQALRTNLRSQKMEFERREKEWKRQTANSLHAENERLEALSAADMLHQNLQKSMAMQSKQKEVISMLNLDFTNLQAVHQRSLIESQDNMRKLLHSEGYKLKTNQELVTAKEENVKLLEQVRSLSITWEKAQQQLSALKKENAKLKEEKAVQKRQADTQIEKLRKEKRASSIKGSCKSCEILRAKLNKNTVNSKAVIQTLTKELAGMRR